MSQIVRGNIDPEQIKAIRRQGDSSVIQMAGTGVKTPGDILIYDANGNAVDGGAPSSGVPTSRRIDTTAPLTGGGDLSANRTLAVSVATSSSVGVVEPDNSSITVNASGVLTAIGGGSGTLPTSGWTEVNGSIVQDFAAVGIEVMIPFNASLNWRFGMQPLPAAPYTVIAVFDAATTENISAITAEWGLYLYDGTKFEGIELLGNSSGAGQVIIEKANNVTGLGAAVLSGPTAALTVGRFVAFKIVDDNTAHRTFYYYKNGAWVQQFQETNGSFLTPTKAGVGGICVTATSGYVSAVCRYFTTSSP
jgi:hypothetical protein